MGFDEQLRAAQEAAAREADAASLRAAAKRADEQALMAEFDRVKVEFALPAAKTLARANLPTAGVFESETQSPNYTQVKIRRLGESGWFLRDAGLILTTQGGLYWGGTKRHSAMPQPGTRRSQRNRPKEEEWELLREDGPKVVRKGGPKPAEIVLIRRWPIRPTDLVMAAYEPSDLSPPSCWERPDVPELCIWRPDGEYRRIEPLRHLLVRSTLSLLDNR